MSSISIDSMRTFLSKSICSFNADKLNGLLTEVDFRSVISDLGFSDRVSQGGWIIRGMGTEQRGNKASALFPHVIASEIFPGNNESLPIPPYGLHAVCPAMHHAGVSVFFCVPIAHESDNTSAISWQSKRLGVLVEEPYQPLEELLDAYSPQKTFNHFFCYHTDMSLIDTRFIPELFLKEHLRIFVRRSFMGEMSSVNSIIWGQHHSYLIEMKERTVAHDKKMGNYFGIDVGPFVKLAYYASQRGNLHSLFFVREIDDVKTRNLVNWWFVSFDTLAKYASWVPIAGGTTMGGGRSSVIKIPKAVFRKLTKDELNTL